MAAASPPQDQQQPAAEGAVAREDPAALTPRRARFPRACHYRPNAPPLTPTPAPSPPPPRPRRNGNAGYETPEYRVVTPLVEEPASPAELPRWRLRGMWELASVLNFLHVFRPLLNIPVEFTAEELEDAIITPNGTLDDVHMPLLKSFGESYAAGQLGARHDASCCGVVYATSLQLPLSIPYLYLAVLVILLKSIPPVTRMAMGRGTWIAVLCKKLKHWWHWVYDMFPAKNNFT
ncbi:DDT domain-containing protein DDR4 [Zea mays]|uniref:DDT domain-containing protein DDR4 n=1 Tax=Zea mays TaxID=4577 RepID=A0A1D6L844_MAIZE|nr:DDT domain-containing protein DDR4 [Zea mays]